MNVNGYMQESAGEIEVGSELGQPVHLGATDVGFFLLSPASARAIAGSLLQAADVSEGKLPAHIYTVDCRD